MHFYFHFIIKIFGQENAFLTILIRLNLLSKYFFYNYFSSFYNGLKFGQKTLYFILFFL